MKVPILIKYFLDSGTHAIFIGLDSQVEKPDAYIDLL